MVIVDQIGRLLVKAPSGVWEKIIMAFNSNIANYALAIICLTLVIKLVLFPFDFFNRMFTRKSTKMQAIIQPEIDVLKKKYAQNPKELNAKTLEVYKKHNYNVGGTCLMTLAFMAVTLFVFITLFSGLNKMSNYKIAQQYEDLQVAYYSQLGVENIEGVNALSAEQKNSIDPEKAKADVLSAYEKTKESFLWIENVWIADSPLKNPIPKFSEYASLAGLKDEEKTEEREAEYNKIFGIVDQNVRNQNGYFVIALLTILLTFLQQFVANKKYSFKMKKKNPDEQKQKQLPSNKVMMIIMPLLLGIFGIIYNSVFGLYMLAGSFFAVITTPLCNNILDFIEKKKEEKQKNKEKLTYSRK